jgi:glucose-6-phosphate 1-dehydrogenase
VLKSVRPIPADAVARHACRGQYTAGAADGSPVAGYLDEANVPLASRTETYAAMKLYVDNWRWRGVPFYLRTGKRMARSQSMISICFRQPPQQFFSDAGVEDLRRNWLVLGIQPQECLRMEMTIKEPGLEMRTRQTSLDASLLTAGDVGTDAYEDLLLDVIEGDRSLFLRYDEVEWLWRVVDPVLTHWSADSSPVPTYAAGSWGPEESCGLFDDPGQGWRRSMDLEA